MILLAHTVDCPVAAAQNKEKNLYAIQFHPEVLHTQEGSKNALLILVRNICGCEGSWKMDAFVENTISEIRDKIGDKRYFLRFQEELIRLWQQDFYQEQLANSLPVYL